MVRTACPQSMDEQKTVELARDGDREAFGQLYDAYIKRIYSSIYYKTHHKETAEDLTSATFFKALDKIHSFDPAKPFGPWLYSIARNTVADHYRARKSTISIEDAWDLPDDSDMLKDADITYQMREVREHMRSLTSLQREIITLRLWEGLSYREIAEIVNASESSTKVAFFRAMQKLRSAMPLPAFLLILNAPNL